jgi:hypothetical protein
MLSVSVACHDFPKPFPNNRGSRGGKNEICNYLIWSLNLSNANLNQLKYCKKKKFFVIKIFFSSKKSIRDKKEDKLI